VGQAFVLAIVRNLYFLQCNHLERIEKSEIYFLSFEIEGFANNAIASFTDFGVTFEPRRIELLQNIFWF